ncbi:MAG: hypothetical protein R3C30_10990 [Hyphomonadaceae bacterium]
MYIDFNQIARIGKIVALLGFFLPWVTVSCSNTEILSATGWQLMTGDPQPAGPLEGMADQRQQAEDSEPAVIVITAFAIILIGLGISLVTRAQTAAVSMLVCAVLGIGISYYGVENMRSELRREITEGQQQRSGQVADSPFFSAEQQNDLSRAVASSVTVEEQEGYMVTHGGLLIAAIFSLLTLFARRTPKAEAPPGAAPT